jgi:aspartyl-tRNA(Asn)/glutamyl-tRNA(Gln) amidotransferase subunit C
MTISKKEVEHIALLSRLELSEEEKEIFSKQLSQVLDHAGKISKLSTDDVEPTSHALEIKNVFREDKVKSCLTQEQALSGAPEKESGGFKVPKIS